MRSAVALCSAWKYNRPIHQVRRSCLAALLSLVASSVWLTEARAEMRLDDLTKVRVDTATFPEADWTPRKEAARLTLACITCEGFTAIDMQLLRAEADMEERIRDGVTTADTMLDLCRKNAAQTGAECFGLKRSDLKGAVGFVSDVRVFGGTYSATYTLYQDGTLLLMRSVAASREAARKNGGKALKALASQVVR